MQAMSFLRLVLVAENDNPMLTSRENVVLVNARDY